MRTIRLTVATMLAAVLGMGIAPCPMVAPASAETLTPVVWLCRPSLAANPCEIPLDTTNLAGDSGAEVTTPHRPRSVQRAIDCFYVYPTVSNQLGVNATKAKDPEIVSIAKYQASRFSSQCRMYAPVYRQVPLAGLATLPLGISTAYADVRQAWRSYLAKDNSGRGFVLIGHSQGTILLRKLIAEEIDGNAAIRDRMVGAVLMGGNVTVKAGSTRGGDFVHTPVCTAQGQHGCVTAYSTYSTNPVIAFFGNSLTDITSPMIGRRSGLGYRVACTDPALLSGITRPVGITIPSEPFAAGLINLGIAITAGGTPPTAETTWVRPADRVQGACRTINGAHVYRFHAAPGSRALHEFPPTWGTHLVDMNLGLERLVRIVHLQRQSWLAAHGG